MHRTQISVEDELMELARVEAAARGVSFAELCRRGLRAMVGGGMLAAEPGAEWQVEPSVTIDGAGRLVVPKAVRDALGLAEGATLRVGVRDGCVVLQPVRVEPRVIEVDGLLLLAGPDAEAWPDHRDLREERMRRLEGE